MRLYSKYSFLKPIVKTFTLFFLVILFFGSSPVFSADTKNQPAAPSDSPNSKDTPAASRKSSRDFPMINVFDKRQSQVEVVADNLEYSKDEKKMIARGNVVVIYENNKMLSDFAEVETDTKETHAKGHVLFFRNDLLVAEGEEVFYNFGNHTGQFPNSRNYSFPWIGGGTEMRQIRQGVLEIDNAHFSNCEYEKPHWEMKASKATIYEGEKIIAWNVKIYILGKPVFWWPYFVIPLKWLNVPLSAAAGYNSEDGYYIETVKGVEISEHLSGKLLNDWRSKRGYATGGILDYNYGPMAKGDFTGYWTRDENAPTRDLDNPFSERETRNRYRMTLRHRTDFDPYTNVITRINKISDAYVLQDFFEKEYRSETEQQSFATFTKNNQRFGMMAHVEKRLNDFEAIVQRLPELRFDWKNQPFFKPWLFYENQASYANLDMVHGYSNTREAVNRVDNVHEWSVPLRYKDIKFTPFANLRGTYYSRMFQDSEPVFRFSSGYGMDLRTQLYKTMNVSSDKFGIEINKLRHVLEPSFKIQSVHPNTEDTYHLTHFDRIDLVQSMDVFTPGLENRIQTKRVVNGRMRVVDIVSLNTYLNYAIHPQLQDVSTGFRGLNVDLILRPYQWLQYELRMSADPQGKGIQTFNQDLILQRNKVRILFGQRYVRNPDYYTSIGTLDSSDQLVFEGTYTLNALWEAHGYIRWDAKTGDLSEWQIGATRDLHDFFFDFGYNVRNSDIHTSNKEVYFNLRMKQFPQFALRSGSGRASFGAPRIGETVAGANQFGSMPGGDRPFEQSYT